MSQPRSRARFVAMIVLCAGLSGCHWTGGRSWFHRSPAKPAWTDPMSSTLDTTDSKPLGLEQKADLQIAVARSFESQGRMDDAKRLYLQVIESLPEHTEANHRLALLLDRKGECAAAEPYYRRIIELKPEDAEWRCDLGYSYYLQQRWPEAETEFREAIARSPGLRRAHNNLGLLLARTGRGQDAIAEFAQAGCSRAQAEANLAFAFTLAGRWQDAQAAYRRALYGDPDLTAARDGLRNIDSLLAKASQTPQNPGGMPSSREAALAGYVDAGPPAFPASSPPVTPRVADASAAPYAGPRHLPAN